MCPVPGSCPSLHISPLIPEPSCLFTNNQGIQRKNIAIKCDVQTKIIYSKYTVAHYHLKYRLDIIHTKLVQRMIEGLEIKGWELLNLCVYKWSSLQNISQHFTHHLVSASDELPGFMLMSWWFVTWGFYSIFTTHWCLLQLRASDQFLWRIKTAKFWWEMITQKSG